jgi:hypothetical protein
MLEGSIGHYLLTNILIETKEPLVRHIFNTHNRLLLIDSYSLFCLPLQPQLDQPADGLGACGAVLDRPCINRRQHRFRKANVNARVTASGRGAAATFWCYLN